MIAQIMRYCQNYFSRTYENKEVVFDATGKTITGVTKTYKAGQYICVRFSYLNDGVYTVTGYDSENGVITVSESLTDETDTCQIFGLAVPTDFVSLVAEITSWITNNSPDGVANEKIDDYSIEYSSDAQKGGWQGAYKRKLAQYRKMYCDLDWTVETYVTRELL
jgi:hypothetical protein